MPVTSGSGTLTRPVAIPASVRGTREGSAGGDSMQAAKLLRELVALPSVNPGFVRAGDPTAGEHRVGEYLAARAMQLGLEVDRQEVLPGRHNVLIRLGPARPARQRILLAPHLDTVVAGEGQLVPRLARGRLYGRGACDTKGSLAAMFTALAAVAARRRRPQDTEIVLAGLVDEENLQAGSRALARAAFRADLAIVGEPTRLDVVTAHKGDLWLRLETRGKAAHGALPHLGRNAVYEMGRVLAVIEGEYAAHLRRRRHPVLGSPTVSVGRVSGGTQPNIVPDHCAIEVDRRTLPGETDAGVMRELGSWLRRRGLRVRMSDIKGAPSPPLETDPRLPWVQELMRCVGQRRVVGVHFFCDAAVLAAAGIPSVVFGPGDIAQAHTAEEWISLRELEAATRVLTRFLEGLP